ncbi:MAG: KaiB domain protein [Rhodocyclaceae bacterium]|nr:KaiB domain protein [Rhodocyclaceae bacterium]
MDKDANQDKSERYVLRLFVSGATRRSTEAIANIKAICERELAGRYELEVIDIYQLPQEARSEEVVAVPTLVKKLPVPIRRLIGDLSEEEKVLVGLDLRPRP